MENFGEMLNWLTHFYQEFSKSIKNVLLGTVGRLDPQFYFSRFVGNTVYVARYSKGSTEQKFLTCCCLLEKA